MKHYDETRTQLSENDILDMQLGRISKDDAINLLLNDLKSSEDHVDDCVEFIRDLYDKINTALIRLDEIAESVETMQSVLSMQIEEDVPVTKDDLEVFTDETLKIYADAYRGLEE